jgi:hypothetical protein
MQAARDHPVARPLASVAFDGSGFMVDIKKSLYSDCVSFFLPLGAGEFQ